MEKQVVKFPHTTCTTRKWPHPYVPAYQHLSISPMEMRANSLTDVVALSFWTSLMKISTTGHVCEDLTRLTTPTHFAVVWNACLWTTSPPEGLRQLQCYVQHCNWWRPSQSKRFTLPSISTATWLLNNCSAPYQCHSNESLPNHWPVFAASNHPLTWWWVTNWKSKTTQQRYSHKMCQVNKE